MFPFRPHRVALAVQAALALVAMPAFATHDADTEDAPERAAGIVTIRATRPLGTLPAVLPSTVEGISADELARRVNATDAEDALKYLPSLLVRKRYIGDYNHAVLSTRASGTGNSARSLVYADGVLLSNLLGNGASFTPRWGLVAAEEIERVDVLYGPFSAAYAGNSVGAVVDYVTRMPSRFEAHAKVGLAVQPYRLYGTDTTFGAQQADVTLGSRDGAWSWWLAAGRTHSDGQPLTFATRSVASTPASASGTAVSGAVLGADRFGKDWWLLGDATRYATTQDHAKAKVALDLTSTLRASATLGLWDNRSSSSASSYLRDASGAVVDNTSGGGITNTVNLDGRAVTLAASDFPRTREGLTHRLHALALQQRDATLGWQVVASGYRYERDLARGWAPSASNANAGRLTDQGGTGWDTLAAQVSWRPTGPDGAHQVDAGLQRDSFRLRQRSWTTADWISGEAQGTPTSQFQGRTRLTSLWAQDRWRFTPHWQAVTGLRLEDWRAWDGLTANASGAVAHAARSEQHASPKLALGWSPDDAWSVKLATGRALRMPTVSELFQGGLNTAGTALTLNDPTLKPERSQTTEFSVEHDDGHRRLRATLFHERTHDALYSQTNTTVTPNVTNIQNIDLMRTLGVELVADARNVGGVPVDLTGSVTYADSTILKNDKFPASVGAQQPRVPRWRATALAEWRVNADVSTTLAARYGGTQYGSLDNSDTHGATYQGFSRFFTVDWRARWRFAPSWTLAGGIDNLNNAVYWNFHPYPQRTFHAELRYDL